MKSMLALWRREYLEHKGAFLYAPAIIVLVFALTLIVGLGGGRFRVPAGLAIPNANGIFEMSFLAMAALWWLYLTVMVFFYFADAFSADRRNNSMFFWKSMPQSDFKMLGSKFLTGTIVFPALVLGALLTTGVLLFVTTGIVSLMEPRLVAPHWLEMIGSIVQIGIAAFVSFVLGMLWYAPFLAWVGGLSTVVGRWSIPLAFVIPGLAMVLENVLFFGEVPQGGYLYQFLSWRFQYGLDRATLTQTFFSDDPVSAPAVIGAMLTQMDWTALGLGLLFALAVVYAASEYRRRIIS